MSNKEYEEMFKLFLRLKYLIKRYDDVLDATSEEDTSEPIMIPPDVYDDMCDEMGTNEIGLMGIT